MHKMKKVLAITATTVTVLTLVSLFLDIPTKLVEVYRSALGYGPEVHIGALFMEQPALSVSSYTDDATKGYMKFKWDATYVVFNPNDKGVPILDIENITPEINVPNYKIQFQKRPDNGRFLEVFDGYEKWRKQEGGITERFPYTVAAGKRIYIKVGGEYVIFVNEKIAHCRTKIDCYKMLAIALGVNLKEGDPVPCVKKKFVTKVRLVGYRDQESDQEALLPIEGCKFNAEKMIEFMFKNKVMIEKNDAGNPGNNMHNK